MKMDKEKIDEAKGLLTHPSRNLRTLVREMNGKTVFYKAVGSPVL